VKRLSIILAVAPVLSCGAAAGGPPASGPARPLSATEEAAVVKLIARMGASSYSERQAAYDALSRMGPSILPVLQRYRDHDDAEISARVASLIKQVGWTQRGALVVRIQPGTQAVKLDFRPGDAVVKVDDTDITCTADLMEMDDSTPRTCTVWRCGRLLTRKAGPGKIGIYIRNWDFDRGGEAHARGLSAAVDGEFERAYRLLLKAGDHWADDPWTQQVMVGLAEYNLDHQRAMEHYRDVRSILRDTGAWAHEFEDGPIRGLPLAGAHTAWLLERARREEFSPDLYGELIDWFTRQGRNLPLARHYAARKWPEVGSGRDLYRHRCARLRIAFHDRRWPDVLSEYEQIEGLGAQAAREAVLAALQAGDVPRAGRIGLGIIAAYAAGRLGSFDASHSLAALAAAAAAGREDLVQAFQRELRGLGREQLGSLFAHDVRYLFTYRSVNAGLSPMLSAWAAAAPSDRLQYVYLDALRFLPGCSPAMWRRDFARYAGGDWQPEEYHHWLNAEAMLRFGRYEEARRAAGKFYPKYVGLEASRKAVEFLSANARRLETDWSVLKGVIQVYDAAAEGSRWAVRYDGRTFHVGPDGKLREFPGLTPGEVHRSICGDCIRSFGTGTVYVRRGQIYLLDEKAGRWIKTHTSPARVPAYGFCFDDATGPVVLRHAMKHYPLADGGRELKFREAAPGGWRLYHFNGDRVLAVRRGTREVVDLGRRIGRQAGLARPAAVYRIWVRGPKPLIPTDAGLWTMEAAGKLSRIDLGLREPNVMVSVLSWPKREGRRYVGVAPQQGGQVFEIDLATYKATLTEGYCGMGPADSYHWFMHDRHEKRFVPGERAVQALCERAAAGAAK